jgi:Xaa-Pro dipeptidase
MFAWLAAVQGRSMLFMPRLPASYGVWMGVIQGPDYYKAKYAVDEVAYIDDIASVLAAAGAPCIHLLSGTNTDRCVLAYPRYSRVVLSSA